MSAHCLQLGTHLGSLRRRFLPDERLRELSEPGFFERDFDARAFLVLVHSSFEQFFEDIAAEFAQRIVDMWIGGSPPSKQLVVSVAALSVAIGDLSRALDTPDADDEAQLPTDIDPRTRLTECLRDGLSKYRKRLDKNHGVDLHYLRKLFIPLGIRVNPPPDARSALTHIANARGSFAHRRTVLTQGKFAYNPISASDAVADTERLFHWCMDFESELSDCLQPPYDRIHALAKAELLKRLCVALRNTIAER